MSEIWPIEEIPTSATLYCRVHKNFISSKTGKPKETAFHNTPRDGDNLSSDWNKYTTAEESRARIGLQINPRKNIFKTPEDFYIIEFQVQDILDHVPDQSVTHDPVQNIPEVVGTPNNRSHAIIIGEKNDPEIRLKLVDICEWAIGPA